MASTRAAAATLDALRAAETTEALRDALNTAEKHASELPEQAALMLSVARERVEREAATSIVEALRNAESTDALREALAVAEAHEGMLPEDATLMLSVARERVAREVEQMRAAAKQRMIDDFEAHFEAMQLDAVQQVEAAYGSSSDHVQNEIDQLCCICMVSQRDASMVHGDTAHICCCLECARTLVAKGNPCPICNEPIDTVLRNFFA